MHSSVNGNKTTPVAAHTGAMYTLQFEQAFFTFAGMATMTLACNLACNHVPGRPKLPRHRVLQYNVLMHSCCAQ